MVTSGTFSPCLERGIGMAYVSSERAEPGTRIEIDVRGTNPSRRRRAQASVPKGILNMADPSYPDDLLYHPEHDWARVEGDHATFGITWYAQDALGEVVFFDPPEVGAQLKKDEAYTEVESVKAVSDVFAPLSGEVTEVNDALKDKPETINEDPYGEGWLVKIKLVRPVRGRVADGRRGLRGDAQLSGPFRKHHESHYVTSYVSATDADRREMLATIGVSSIEELFADIPESLRLTRPLALDAGRSELEVFEELRELAAAQRLHRGRAVVPRRRHVRPLRAGADRLDHRTVGVPDAVHALPAGDLAGRPAGDVRVPDRDLGADRAPGVQRVGVRGPERGRRRRLRGEGRGRLPVDGSWSRAACTRTRARRCGRWRTHGAWRSSRRRCTTASRSSPSSTSRSAR